MCEALISIMHESRVAPERSVEVATSGFQLLQLMHRLQPHVTLHTRRDADDLTSKGLGLLVHPLAWAPIDGDARARASIVGGGTWPALVEDPRSPICPHRYCSTDQQVTRTTAVSQPTL
jgi:hypothetical protein